MNKCLGDDKDKKALPFIECAGKCNNNGKKSDYLDVFLKNWIMNKYSKYFTNTITAITKSILFYLFNWDSLKFI